MIQTNRKTVGQKKIKNKPGGAAHESRFGGLEREMRVHKRIIAPSINTNSMIVFEQAWNKQSEKKDLVRVTIGKSVCICERDYIEQALATLAQGDEVIKYQAPMVG